MNKFISLRGTISRDTVLRDAISRDAISRDTVSDKDTVSSFLLPNLLIQIRILLF
jgi:hypothetical protein